MPSGFLLDELGPPQPTEERDTGLTEIRGILRDALALDRRFQGLEERLGKSEAVLVEIRDQLKASAGATERQAVAAELAAEEAQKMRREAHHARLEAAAATEVTRAEAWARQQESLKGLGKLLAWVLPLTGAAVAGAREIIRLIWDGPTP